MLRNEVGTELEIADSVRLRADEVVSQLLSLKTSLVSNSLHMGDLLLETKQNNYHLVQGYNNFEEWLEASNLGLKISQAYYLMRIVTKAKYLDIPRSELEKCDITALKEIISLDEDEQADEIKELISFAQENPNKETLKKVNEVKKASGKDIYILKGFRFHEDAWNHVILPAIEQVRLAYGQVLDADTGEYIEVTEGKAIEILAAEWNSGH